MLAPGLMTRTLSLPLPLRSPNTLAAHRRPTSRLPANDTHHNLPAGSISVYFQPEELVSPKQHIIGCGDGTQIGDFSVELNAAGTLRGYHVGQDGVLRFWGSFSSIPGSVISNETAYRMDLTFGSDGAKIYIDGVLLDTIEENTNFWNNTRVKVFGAWTNLTQGFANMAFDRLRVWDGPLTQAEIDDLPAAQTATISGEEPPAPTGDVLSVPSLAEWLVSDETDPAVTKYVSDQDRGDGSGSSAANAQEVQDALDGASPGDVLLAVCQTPGTVEHWNYPSGLSFPSGTAGQLDHVASPQRRWRS